MKVISGGICAVRGVKAFGAKEGKNGLAVITGGGQAAGVFTKNKVEAAPIIVTREHLQQREEIYAVIATSGSANAFTGARGIADARLTTTKVAEILQIHANQVAVASTGVIGKPLNSEWIDSKLTYVIENLRDDEEGSLYATKAIMTTDTTVKHIAVDIGGVTIAGIAKGAGMIEPNMATMLAFIYTDARFSSSKLKRCLVRAVDQSFNMITVDGDTSTNDVALLITTGLSELDIPLLQFQAGLNFVCVELAKMIIKDGEGATKFIEVRVTGAKTRRDAIKAAKAVVRSPLVKTAIFGADPNWGRIVAAVGYSGAAFKPELLSLAISDRLNNGVRIISKGMNVSSEEGAPVITKASQIMQGDHLTITIDLGAGTKRATAWGCDLTYDYVRINAEYST